jgi:hypothetical protein
MKVIKDAEIIDADIKVNLSNSKQNATSLCV